jgi:glutathione S-transferase
MPAEGKLVVHHLNNSRSQRILWLLEELEVPYDLKRYERDKVTMLAPPELKAVHPLGKSPVVTDGDATLAESGAIIEYIALRYGNGRFIPPPGTPERLRYTYWLHYAEGSAMPPLLLKLIFDKIETSPMPFFVRPIAKGISAKVKNAFIDPQIKTHFDFMEAELGTSTWFAGSEITGADVQMSFPVEASAAGGVVGNDRPNLLAFVKRVHERPAYKRALERGGPYDYA